MRRAHSRRKKYIANEQLKMYRQQRGLSQAQLGELIGRDQSIIARMESGEIPTTAHTAGLLAPHLGVEPQDLFPRAAGSPRRADAGGMDADILSRAMAITRRWGRDDEAWVPAAIALIYGVLARERDGHPITDDEATLALFDVFMRRLRDNFRSR